MSTGEAQSVGPAPALQLRLQSQPPLLSTPAWNPLPCLACPVQIPEHSSDDGCLHFSPALSTLGKAPNLLVPQFPYLCSR